jgi:hypothetical protein
MNNPLQRAEIAYDIAMIGALETVKSALITIAPKYPKAFGFLCGTIFSIVEDCYDARENVTAAMRRHTARKGRPVAKGETILVDGVPVTIIGPIPAKDMAPIIQQAYKKKGT